MGIFSFATREVLTSDLIKRGKVPSLGQTAWKAEGFWSAVDDL
jgi:hypothetical protein